MDELSAGVQVPPAALDEEAAADAAADPDSMTGAAASLAVEPDLVELENEEGQFALIGP
ncbi:hypothetical protein [Streptomyces hygroscopicus]|uniref:hypothetical protein n=1 Tax=Streptomyces hygroscopicus TaxID=1912 RepID=UPI00131DD4E7|nr:hypothetical protein [Streptomyces hygroscopicus]